MTMNKTNLLLVPSGGLANRMRAIASAWNLCQEIDARLQVVWFQGWGMHAAFHELFEPWDAKGPTLREACWYDYILNDRPRRHNLWLPWLPQYLYYHGKVINELDVASLRDHGFDFMNWLRDKQCYMSCYDEFGAFPETCYADMFRPNHQVMRIVSEMQNSFSEYTIGMHIRRTDHIDSIRNSPLELFFDKGHEELQKHQDLKIFLATDSEDVKLQMRKEFGSHVFFSTQEASRNSAQGIREGLADMWTLSRVKKIYGSSGSSFSVMASRVGGNELVILEK